MPYVNEDSGGLPQASPPLDERRRGAVTDAARFLRIGLFYDPFVALASCYGNSSKGDNLLRHQFIRADLRLSKRLPD